MNDLNFEKNTIITLQVVCNSKKQEFYKENNYYKLKLKSPPLKGKANKELKAFFKSLGYNIEIKKGFKNNTKIIKIN